MPLKSVLRKLVCCAFQEQDEEEVQTEQPLLELAADEPMEPETTLSGLCGKRGQ